MHTNDYRHKKYRGIDNEVQDVMGEMPQWTMWRGTLFVFLMFLFSIVTASLLHYAETIKGVGGVVINHDVSEMTDSVAASGFRPDSVQMVVDMKMGGKEIQQISRGDNLIVILEKDRTEIKGRILEVFNDNGCVCNVNMVAQCYIPSMDVFRKLVERRDANISVTLEESSLADKVIRYVSF